MGPIWRVKKEDFHICIIQVGILQVLKVFMSISSTTIFYTDMKGIYWECRNDYLFIYLIGRFQSDVTHDLLKNINCFLNFLSECLQL